MGSTFLCSGWEYPMSLLAILGTLMLHPIQFQHGYSVIPLLTVFCAIFCHLYSWSTFSLSIPPSLSLPFLPPYLPLSLLLSIIPSSSLSLSFSLSLSYQSLFLVPSLSLLACNTSFNYSRPHTDSNSLCRCDSTIWQRKWRPISSSDPKWVL